MTAAPRQAPLTGLRLLLCAWCGLLAVFCLTASVRAADPDPAARQLEPIAVKFDRPQTWPEGDWLPIRRGELQRLIERATSPGNQPRHTWIEEATYTATFDGDSLRAGKLVAEVRHQGHQAELLSLEPLNLAFSELSWSEGPAVWGTLRDGDSALLVDGQQSTLFGQWNLTGRKLPRSVEFNIEIPGAVVSRMRFLLPDEFTLSASTGEVKRLEENGTSGLRQWQLDLGSQTRCHLAIRRRPEPTDARPLVLAETNHSYVISEGGVQLQSEFQVESAGAPVNLLVFDVPPEIKVFSVTYGNGSVAWRGTSHEGKQQLAVKLADPLQGRGRTIRIGGIAVFQAGQTWRLPLPRLAAASFSAAELSSLPKEFFNGDRSPAVRRTAFLNGQVHLKVDSPLKLQSVQADGFRQTATVTTAGISSSLSYQQYRADAFLELEVDYPDLRRDANVLTYVDMSDDEWSMTVAVDWSTKSGKTFETRSEVAPAWEVTEVRPRNDASALTNWQVRRERGGKRTLSIEFREAISPGSPKSVRVSARRLSSPAPSAVPRQRLLRVPLLRPLEHGSVEQVIALSPASAARPAVKADSALTTIGIDDVPEFARDSELWPRIESAAGDSLVLLHATDAAASARLRLEQPGPAVDAHFWITHALDAKRLTETIAGRLQPRGEAIQRVHVYLTSSGGDVEWRLKSAEPEPLKAIRLPADRHGDWDLPPGGELWEIQLPRPSRRTVTIVGTRSRNVTASIMPTLAVIPGLKSFHGIVELQASRGLNVAVEVEGLVSLDPASIDAGEFPDSKVHPPTGQLWRFHSADETLLLRVRGSEQESAGQRIATLHVESILSEESPGYDRHSATLHLLGGAENDVFLFELPRPAVLLSAALNDNPVTPLRRGGSWAIAHAQLGGPSRVRIEYQTPSAAGWLGRSRQIPLPDCSCTILEFDWRFAVPPDVWLVEEPRGMLLSEPLPELSWTERFFGPLGRPADRGMFNPFSRQSWTELLSAGKSAPRDQRQSAAGQFSPPGWTVHQAAAPHVPRRLVLSTRLHSQAWLLAWLGTLGCLLAGLLMRVRLWSFRKGAFGYWLSSCLFAAWLSPPFYAIIAGGCVVGTTVALLFPRRLLEKLRFQKTSTDEVPVGSTATFHNSPATALLLLSLLLVARSSAQEPAPEEPMRDGLEPAEVSEDAPRPPIRILVPESGNKILPGQQPAPDEKQIVYVKRSTLADLQSAARRLDRKPRYLVASADYSSRVDEQNSVVVTAKHKVYLLPGVRTARVAFPNARANPGDCRVNGQPHPIVLGDDEQQFFVELNSDSEEVPSPGTLHSFDIELTLRPATEAIPGGGGMRLDVIPVAAARLAQTFARPQATVELMGVRGEQSLAGDRRSLSALLGKTGEFRLLWSTNAEPVQVPVKLEAAVTTYVEAHPDWLQYHYRVDYQVISGQVDFVVWHLPHAAGNMVVREVTLGGRSTGDFTASPFDRGHSRLLVQFASAQEQAFVVEARVIVPLAAGGGDTIDIPAPITIDQTAQPYAISTTGNLLGISAPPEFDMSRTMPVPTTADIQSVSLASYQSRTSGHAASRTPRFAFEVPRSGGTLTFDLVPAAPLRKVRMIQTGTVRGDVLDWTLSAEVETSRAPAFRHRLRVPPQLAISGIHVVEDEAERLVHWSRRGDIVELFLSDKTTSIQTIQLKGERKLPRARPVPLPLITIDDADTVDLSSLFLRHEPKWAVELLDSQSLQPVSGVAAPLGDGQNFELLGQYSVTAGGKPPRIVVRPRGEHLTSNLAVSITRPAEGKWRIAYRYEFASGDGDPAIDRIRLRVPPRLAEQFQFEAADADVRRIAQPDGATELDLKPKSQPMRRLTARIVATLDEPPPGNWSLPWIGVENLESAGHYLLISDGVRLEPSGRNVDQVLPASLPAAVRQLLGPDGDDGAWDAYFVGVSQASLAVGPTDAKPQIPRIPLVETGIVRGTAGSSYGRTSVWLANFADGQLELSWPRGLVVRALFVDGQSAVPNRPDANNNRLSISLASGTGPHRMVVHWMQPAAKTSSRWPPRSQPIPQPLGVKAERSVVRIVPPGNAFLTVLEPLEDIDRLDYALDVLEGLYELNALGGNQPTRLPMRSMLDRQRQLIAAAMAHRTAGMPTSEQLARFRRISRDIKKLPPPERESAAAERPAGPAVGEVRPSQIPLAPNRMVTVGRMSPSDEREAPVISFWAVRNWVVAVILLLACLPLIPVVRWLVRREIGRWLMRHQPAAWALLGMFWWTCLRQSELGIVLLVVALVVAVRDRRSAAQRSDSVVDVPSTVIPTQ